MTHTITIVADDDPNGPGTTIYQQRLDDPDIGALVSFINSNGRADIIPFRKPRSDKGKPKPRKLQEITQ